MQPEFYHVDYSKAFQREMLEILGIDNKKILDHGRGNLLRILIAPPIISFPRTASTNPGGFIHCVPLSSLEFLRRKMITEKPNSINKRLYITRRKASQRRVVNEQVVFNKLIKYGFEFIELEHLIKEQIKLFASAEIVVAPHGAGLTNITFCEPGTPIIELSQEDEAPYSFCFWAISQQLHLNHIYIVCEKNKLNQQELIQKDMYVDTDILERQLNDLGF